MMMTSCCYDNKNDDDVMLVWYIYCVKFIVFFIYRSVIFMLNFYRKNLASGKAGLVGPSAEGQLDPPASLRTPVRLVYHCVVGVGSGPFPPLKPAGALVHSIRYQLLIRY